MKYLYSYCGRPTRQWYTYHRVLGCQIGFVASKHNWLCRFVSVLCPIWAASNHFAEYRLIFGENMNFWVNSIILRRKSSKIEIIFSSKMTVFDRNSIFNSCVYICPKSCFWHVSTLWWPWILSLTLTVFDRKIVLTENSRHKFFKNKILKKF